MASRYQSLLQQLRSKKMAPSSAVSAQTTPTKPLGGTGVLSVGGQTASPSASQTGLVDAARGYEGAQTPIWSGDPTMVTSPINPGPYASATAMPPPTTVGPPAAGAPAYPVAAAAQGVPPPTGTTGTGGAPTGGATFPGGTGAGTASTGGGGAFPGGGGGGSASTTGPFYQPGGAAGDYLGDVGAGYIFSNPESMLANQLGGASGGLYNMLAPLAGLANPYFMLMNPMGGTNTNAQGLNFMDQFWSGAQQTGNFFNYDALMGSLLNPQGWLQAYLGDQYNDPAAQAQAFGQMYEAIVRGTQHPLFAKAMMGALDNTESEYLGQAAMGNISPYGQYVQNAIPFL